MFPTPKAIKHLPPSRAHPYNDLSGRRQGDPHRQGGRRLRAGGHAIAAAHAEVGIVGNRAAGGLVEGLNKADRGASRLVAMHALLLDEYRLARIVRIVESVDDREGVRVRPAFMLEYGLVLIERQGP